MPLSAPTIAPERAILEQRGVRPTRQRLAILAALRACHGEHPTAEELHRLVNHGAAHPIDGGADDAEDPLTISSHGIRTRGRCISLATVYNTLEALHRAGLCRLVPTPEARRWDAGTHDHVHLRITNEQVVVDLPTELGNRLLHGVDPALIREIESRLNVRVDGFSIQIDARRREPD